jgi:mannose/fructose/N-acetylgalactosamine-specific phosphotransferase system component IID
LFTNYTSALRPVEETENILNVILQITLSQIIDMVTAFLSLNYGYFSNTTIIKRFPKISEKNLIHSHLAFEIDVIF